MTPSAHRIDHLALTAAHASNMVVAPMLSGCDPRDTAAPTLEPISAAACDSDRLACSIPAVAIITITDSDNDEDDEDDEHVPVSMINPQVVNPLVQFLIDHSDSMNGSCESVATLTPRTSNAAPTQTATATTRSKSVAEDF